MNIRTPQTGTSAKIAREYLKAQGLNLSHSRALELIARIHGYSSWQAMEADPQYEDPLALKSTSSHEYELRADARSAWIKVEGISVAVTRCDEGVTVDLYATGREDNSLAGTSLFFHEVEEDDEEPFEETLVDWQRVANNDDISWLRFDKNPERIIANTNKEALVQLHLTKTVPGVPMVSAELARSPAYEYLIADAGGASQSLTIGRLVAATESEPGVLRLLNGQILQLLIEAENGERLVYSPSLNRIVS